MRRGGVIAIDNTLWSGSVADRAEETPIPRRSAPSTGQLHRDKRVDVALVPIGDGLTLA